MLAPKPARSRKPWLTSRCIAPRPANRLRGVWDFVVGQPPAPGEYLCLGIGRTSLLFRGLGHKDAERSEGANESGSHCPTHVDANLCTYHTRQNCCNRPTGFAVESNCGQKVQFLLKTKTQSAQPWNEVCSQEITADVPFASGICVVYGIIARVPVGIGLSQAGFHGDFQARVSALREEVAVHAHQEISEGAG